MDARESPLRQLLQRGANLALPVGAGGLWHDAADQVLGVVDQYARRLARGIAQNPSARRIRRLSRDSGLIQHRSVHPRGMTVDAIQNDRVPVTDRIELVSLRKYGRLPKALIPAPAKYPCLARSAMSGLRNLCEDLGFR